MTRVGRVRAEVGAASKAFLRRRTAVFFTFVFPLLLVVIFGAIVQTRPGGGGLFSRPSRYYVPGYLAVVVLFTPLSRVGSEVARHREGNRFEKLATTPLTRGEWLAGQTAVNAVVVGLAGLLVLAVMAALTGASMRVDAVTLLAVPAYVAVGVAAFCGLGAILGSVTESQDGVIAASNAVALPLVFLSETFVSPALLPAWLPTGASPLTFFARGVRAAVTPADAAAGGVASPVVTNLVVLAVWGVAFFAVGARLLPRTD